MEKPYVQLTPELAAELQDLFNEFDKSFRHPPVLRCSVATIIGLLGLSCGLKIFELLNPVIGQLIIFVSFSSLIFGIRKDISMMKSLDIRPVWQIKRELKKGFGLSPEGARAILAQINGPTVLDQLASENKKRHSEKFSAI